MSDKILVVEHSMEVNDALQYGSNRLLYISFIVGGFSLSVCRRAQNV